MQLSKRSQSIINPTVEVPIYTWKVIERTSRYQLWHLDGEPDYLHIVKLLCHWEINEAQVYAVTFEDFTGIGDTVEMTAEEVKNIYNIKL
jgi:hypothetical protein